MPPILNIPDLSGFEIVVVILGGAVGALVKDTLQDGALKLPYIKAGKLYLGFVGGMVVGAFVGVVVDGSFITALLGGYTGTSVIANLYDNKNTTLRSFNKNKTTTIAPDKESITS
jgi:hypothetical protein